MWLDVCGDPLMEGVSYAILVFGVMLFFFTIEIHCIDMLFVGFIFFVFYLPFQLNNFNLNLIAYVVFQILYKCHVFQVAWGPPHLLQCPLQLKETQD